MHFFGLRTIVIRKRNWSVPSYYQSTKFKKMTCPFKVAPIENHGTKPIIRPLNVPRISAIILECGFCLICLQGPKLERISAWYPGRVLDLMLLLVGIIALLLCYCFEGHSPGWASQGREAPPPWRFGHPNVIKRKHWISMSRGGQKSCPEGKSYCARSAHPVHINSSPLVNFSFTPRATSIATFLLYGDNSTQ